MTGPDDRRVALRKQISVLKETLIEIMYQGSAVEPRLRAPLGTARNALFEAWTILATPLEEDEDH
jgi:hypothetical protein